MLQQIVSWEITTENRKLRARIFVRLRSTTKTERLVRSPRGARPGGKGRVSTPDFLLPEFPTERARAEVTGIGGCWGLSCPEICTTRERRGCCLHGKRCVLPRRRYHSARTALRYKDGGCTCKTPRKENSTASPTGSPYPRPVPVRAPRSRL